MTTRRNSLLIVLVGSIAILATLLTGLYRRLGPVPMRSFEEKKWKSGDEVVRGSMSSSLVESRVLLGSTAEGVRRMLGEPDVSLDGVWAYRVRHHGGLDTALTQYTMKIFFSDDANQRVVVRIAVKSIPAAGK